MRLHVRLLAAVVALAAVTARPAGLGAVAHHGLTRTFTLDVAIDAHTLALNNDDPMDPGNPKRGTTFIVYGKVFPGNTIPTGVTAFDPDQAGSIGTWYCRGVFLASFAEVMGGKAPLAFDTTQMFLLPEENNAIFTEGLEGAIGVTTHRSVTGGTGQFRRVTGTLRQQTIGLNRNGAADGLFDLRFTFTVATDE